MSNPSKAPKDFIYFYDVNRAPNAYITRTEHYVGTQASMKRLDVQKSFLDNVDLSMRPSVIIPGEITCMDPFKGSSIDNPKLAKAKSGKQSTRVRSGNANTVVNEIWRNLPVSGSQYYSQEVVGAKMRNTVMVDGGAENTLGRLLKYLPKEGDKISQPATRAEVAEAIENLSLNLDNRDPELLRALPLITTPARRGISISKKSGNGFPVGKNMDDPEANEMVLRLALTVREELLAAFKRPGGVVRWYEEQIVGRPWLVLFEGKAKGDYYPQEKANEYLLRYYNCAPRQLLLNVQVATQVFEHLKVPITKNPFSHTGIGMNLTKQGSAKMIDGMDQQLERDGIAFVHVGDDSFVAFKHEDKIHMFALDCSAFDLTQHADMSLQVHQVIREQLRRIDAVAADLWFCMMRRRLTAVSSTLVYLMEHGGPSGMPMQSLVNDILMHIFIKRVHKTLLSDADMYGPPDEETVGRTLKELGDSTGFVIKLEQYRETRATTIKAALKEEPFLFVGYNFYVQDEEISVFCDLPRQMSQLPFPGIKWMNTQHDFQVKEAMRLGSSFMSMGVPPRELEAAFNAGRLMCIQLIEGAIRDFGDIKDDSLIWACQMGPHGEEEFPEMSLSGLLRALNRDPRVLWNHPVTVTQVNPASANWAEATEDENEQVRRDAGLAPYPASNTTGLRTIPLAGSLGWKVPTHPVTQANHGRIPPTAVWLPDKPKRAVHRNNRFNARIGHVMPGDDYETEEFQDYAEVDEAILVQWELEDRINIQKSEFGSDDMSVHHSDNNSLVSEDELRRLQGFY